MAYKQEHNISYLISIHFPLATAAQDPTELPVGRWLRRIPDLRRHRLIDARHLLHRRDRHRSPAQLAVPLVHLHLVLRLENSIRSIAVSASAQVFNVIKE